MSEKIHVLRVLFRLTWIFRIFISIFQVVYANIVTKSSINLIASPMDKDGFPNFV